MSNLSSSITFTSSSLYQLRARILGWAASGKFRNIADKFVALIDQRPADLDPKVEKLITSIFTHVDLVPHRLAIFQQMLEKRNETLMLVDASLSQEGRAKFMRMQQRDCDTLIGFGWTELKLAPKPEQTEPVISNLKVTTGDQLKILMAEGEAQGLRDAGDAIENEVDDGPGDFRADLDGTTDDGSDLPEVDGGDFEMLSEGKGPVIYDAFIDNTVGAIGEDNGPQVTMMDKSTGYGANELLNELNPADRAVLDTEPASEDDFAEQAQDAQLSGEVFEAEEGSIVIAVISEDDDQDGVDQTAIDAILESRQAGTISADEAHGLLAKHLPATAGVRNSAAQSELRSTVSDPIEDGVKQLVVIASKPALEQKREVAKLTTDPIRAHAETIWAMAKPKLGSKAKDVAYMLRRHASWKVYA